VNITKTSQIPKPQTFSSSAFPKEVLKHIDRNIVSLLTYDFHLFNKNITILFLVEDVITDNKIKKYNTYVDYMLVWLYILNIYASKDCVDELKIFIYHTSLLKQLPKSNTQTLNEHHINTAFTRTCPKISEIIIFRKEEWFKTFIHETFHNFGLDFSEMQIQQSQCNEKILKIFPVKSDVNLYEAYTEFWARIMNALFCSFNKHNDIHEFLLHAEYFINMERIFAFFQTVKILNFMGLSYTDLYAVNDNSKYLRQTLYKEDTNVLAYYVITLNLLNNYQEFILWCNMNNKMLLQFNKTKDTLNKFCNFIYKNYKSYSILNGIQCSEELLDKTKDKYVINNLRMTICELG
jgi:hypothetical protein